MERLLRVKITESIPDEKKQKLDVKQSTLSYKMCNWKQKNDYKTE